MMARYGTEIQALRHGVHRLFDRPGSAGTGAANLEETSGPRVWAPAVDVSETEHEIVLHAELPGLRREDIDIQLNGDTLTLRGVRSKRRELSSHRAAIRRVWAHVSNRDAD